MPNSIFVCSPTGKINRSCLSAGFRNWLRSVAWSHICERFFKQSETRFDFNSVLIKSVLAYPYLISRKFWYITEFPFIFSNDSILFDFTQGWQARKIAKIENRESRRLIDPVRSRSKNKYIHDAVLRGTKKINAGAVVPKTIRRRILLAVTTDNVAPRPSNRSRFLRSAEIQCHR